MYPKSDKDEHYVLTPAPNGGWVVSIRPQFSGERETVVGAYSNAKHLLEALAEKLT